MRVIVNMLSFIFISYSILFNFNSEILVSVFASTAIPVKCQKPTKRTRGYMPKEEKIRVSNNFCLLIGLNK